MKSRSGKALIQLAAIVFMLNTTTAYGACCFMFAPGETVLDESAQNVLPCHKERHKERQLESNAENSHADKADASSTDMSSDCCLMCVPMLAQAKPQPPKFTHPVTTAQSFQPSAKHATDPPFRPPISYPV